MKDNFVNGVKSKKGNGLMYGSFLVFKDWSKHQLTWKYILRNLSLAPETSRQEQVITSVSSTEEANSNYQQGFWHYVIKR